MTSTSESPLARKLMDAIVKLVDRHGAQIMPILKSGRGGLGQSVLRNDETVRTVPIYCYALLPGVLRVAVKEPSFIAFVMANREALLGRLVDGDPAFAG